MTETCCPYCGAHFTFPPRSELIKSSHAHHFAGAASDDDLVAGSCIRCNCLFVLGEDGQLRKPTVREIAELKSDPEGWAFIEKDRQDPRRPR